MPDINLLLVDDHQVVRTGLRMLLEGQPDMKIVGEADSGLMALEKAKQVFYASINEGKIKGAEGAKKKRSKNELLEMLGLTP